MERSGSVCSVALHPFSYSELIAFSGLLTAEPFYADTLWLRKQVAYDFTTSQELRKEWIRQKKDQAKYGSLKATMHSATILHMIKIGGSMAAALKHAAHFAMNSWLVYKACGLRNYDVECVSRKSLTKRQYRVSHASYAGITPHASFSQT